MQRRGATRNFWDKRCGDLHVNVTKQTVILSPSSSVLDQVTASKPCKTCFLTSSMRPRDELVLANKGNMPGAGYGGAGLGVVQELDPKPLTYFLEYALSRRTSQRVEDLSCSYFSKPCTVKLWNSNKKTLMPLALVRFTQRPTLFQFCPANPRRRAVFLLR